MKQMNSVCLIGRITEQPVLRYTNTNTPYTRFSLAVDRIFKNSSGEKETDFINVIAWKKTAELIVQYLTKGSQMSVTGRIQTGSYLDNQGNRKYSFDVVAENVKFLTSKNVNQNVSEQQAYNNEQTDIFADFGENVVIDDNFLD